MNSIAFALPHTPWVPERVASLIRLEQALHIGPGFAGELQDMGIEYRTFTERAPNSVWCVDMWQWLHKTGASWCLQLQDDVMVAHKFWPALRACLSAVPEDVGVVGLAGVHPMAREIARREHRWYRSPNNLVGWAYAMRHEAMGEFLEARAVYETKFRDMHEDEQIGEWCRRTQRPIWHPVPAICDHDVTIPSSYHNDTHSHRRPAVTWKEYPEAQLIDPEWWKPSGVPDMLQTAPQRMCWFCLERGAKTKSPVSGAGLCEVCILRCVGAMMGIQIGSVNG